MITRRLFIGSLLAAPAIIPYGNLMPVSSRKLWGPPISTVPTGRIGYVRWDLVSHCWLYSPCGEYETWTKLDDLPPVLARLLTVRDRL